MSSDNTQSNYIVQEEGIYGGQPRIAGTRLKVMHIALEYEKRLGLGGVGLCFDGEVRLRLAECN